MKTALKVLTIAIKAITIIMAVIGAIMSIFMLMMGKVYVNNVYDVVDEFEEIDPDNEEQVSAIEVEACRRTISDPHVRNNKFIKAVSYGFDRISSFVANL